MKRLIAACILLLAGCGERIDHGKVVGRQYHPAWDQQCTGFHYIHIGTGKSQTIIPIPYTYTVHHTQRWTVTIAGKTTEGESQVRDLEVPEYQYNTAVVGEQFWLNPPEDAS